MRLMKSLSIAVALAATSVKTAVASVVLFGSVADFAPYNYLDDEGVLQGFEADLSVMICKRAQLDCEWALAPWDNMVTALLQNEFDVIMTGMQITADREVYINFSEEYFPADPSAIMVLTGGITPTEGTVVGAQVDTLQAAYITANGWALSTFETPEDAVQALLGNAVSAVVGDQAYLQQLISASPGTYELVQTDVVIGGGVGLGLRDSDDALLSSLNSAIASLKADGSLDTLIGTWFDGRDPNYRGSE